jgi:hypothetical protein
MSVDEFADTIPVRPPFVNRNMNLSDHIHVASEVSCDPCMDTSRLKILIPVGTAKSIVADAKYMYSCCKYVVCLYYKV